jgi:subtilisin family serine protease
LYSAPGALVLKLALGEAPDDVPSSIDVRSGAHQPAERLRHGALDRVLRDFGGYAQISRVHSAAASITKPGRQHVGFDDLEQVIGLARTFKVDIAPDARVADLVDALRQLSVVEAASPDYLSTLPFAAMAWTQLPADPEQAWQSRRLINGPEALAYEPGHPAVAIMILDTGVAAAHSELPILRPGFDTVQLTDGALAPGIHLLGDYRNPDTNPEDDLVGHGTACAAIIAAFGVRIPPGTAGECSATPVRVLGAAQFPGKDAPLGIGAIANIDAGVKRAVDMGAKVLNMSFGTPASALAPGDPLPHADVCRYGMARNCVMVAASGNNGKVERFLPAAHDGVIAVGSVDDRGRPSAFSTLGEHVAVSAPGERVVTASLQGYQLATGTSFAAPFVAAVAALLISRGLRRSTPLDGPTVKRILCASARPWSNGDAHSGRGTGILDALAALQLLDDEIDKEGDDATSST